MKSGDIRPTYICKTLNVPVLGAMCGRSGTSNLYSSSYTLEVRPRTSPE